MDRWLANFSKNLIAFVVIGGGILFMVLSDPPKTVCDSQVDLIKQNTKEFLFKNPKSKTEKTTKYTRLVDHCKATNNPGGCYELFQEMKMLLQTLSTVPQECGSKAGKISEVKTSLWDTAELLVKIAWGEKPPSSISAKNGWLDIADLSLFCQLKGRITEFYGESAWTKFRERMMKELPGSQDLPRNQVWDMSILSVNCARYP